MVIESFPEHLDDATVSFNFFCSHEEFCREGATTWAGGKKRKLNIGVRCARERVCSAAEGTLPCWGGGL